MLLVVGILLVIFALIFLVYGSYSINDKELSKGIICIVICIFLVAIGVLSIIKGVNSESFKRWTKDIQSEYDGGLYRSIQVVDKDGNTIREYKGKMDIEENSGDKIVFVMEGRKYIIYNNSIFNTIFVEELEEQDVK